MIEERRKHVRFPVMRNVGEPVELQVVKNHKTTSIPGFILNLSAGGMRIVTLGNQASELSIGNPFVLDLVLPGLVSHNVEGKIVSIQKGDKARLHHSNEEWFLGLAFTKIKPTDVHHVNRMAEDWSICETKIQLQLPDICFSECAYFGLCVKPTRLKGKNSIEQNV